MNKRGLSDVVTTVLIILLVLAAVVIIWAFIRPLLDRTSDVSAADCFTVNLEALSCSLTGTVMVERKSGEGDLRAIRFVANGGSDVLDSTNSTEVSPNSPPVVLATQTYTLATSAITSGQLANVRIAAVVGEQGYVCEAGPPITCQ